jgi:hypothetical protein
VADQITVLCYLDLILQNAQIVSEDNRERLADLARRNMLPGSVICELRKVGIYVPVPSGRERADENRKSPHAET